MLKVYYLVCQHCGNVERLYNPNEYTVCSRCNSEHIILLTEEHYKARRDAISAKAPALSYSEKEKLCEEVLQDDFAKHSEFYDKDIALRTVFEKKADSETIFPSKACPRCNSRSTYGGPWSTSNGMFGQTHVTNKYFCCHCKHEWTTRS